MQWRTTLRRAWTDPDTGTIIGSGRYTANGSPTGPGSPITTHGTVALRAATRTGDTISVDAALYADGAGRLDPMEGTGSTTLWRNGIRVGSSATPGSGDFRVTGADARYTMKIESQRGEPHRLSTRTTVDWTFRSAHVAGSRPLPLPLVRFSPPLDTHNSAPAGSTLPIPLSVTGPARVNRIEVSFDDGATWTRAVVWATTLIVRHPPGTGFVSLRATASDNDGNTVDQTIIRAYRYA